jgi:hypothetical protein
LARTGFHPRIESEGMLRWKTLYPASRPNNSGPGLKVPVTRKIRPDAVRVAKVRRDSQGSPPKT